MTVDEAKIKVNPDVVETGVYANRLERPPFMTSEELKDHLAEIGKAIMHDAEILSSNTDRLKLVEIHAEVAPYQQETEIVYRMHRLADPRIHGNS